MKRYILTVLAIWGTSGDTLAQFGYYKEALLFSQSNFGNTARIQGIGGAQIALGGDLSLAHSNPAGLGFFNRGVFSLTPQLEFHDAQSTYLENDEQESMTKFNFSQVGVGLYYGDGIHSSGNFRGGTFAITVNRVNDFNGKYSYQGINNEHSLINSMIENPSQGIVDGAYDNFLLNSHPDNYIFDEEYGEILGFDTIDFSGYSSPFANSVPIQREFVETSGGQYSINMAYGGNLGDMLYFGAGVGIVTHSYEKISTYREWDYFVVTERSENGDISGFPEDALDENILTDRLYISGIGINMDLGVTLRPVPFVTLGVAYRIPTYSFIEEEGSYDFLTYYFDKYDYTVVTIDDQGDYLFETFDLDEHEYLSDVFESSYSLKSPGRLNVGGALFLGKRGFITADLEFVDYRNIKLEAGEFRMDADNEVIRNEYASVVNLRTGGELRFGPVKVRGGYNLTPSAIEGATIEEAHQQFTGGLGFRNEQFYADLTGVYQKQKSYVSPYSLSAGQTIADIDISKFSTMLTLGVTF